MINMLCRFDLKPETTFQAFDKQYSRFFADMHSMGLVESTGRIGKRILDTPMDTDAVDAQKYYVVMTFLDRDQLDRSYAHISLGDITPDHLAAHVQITQAVANPIFTCWQDDN